MSLQVCLVCGWSKFTTYQGLRTHQGKKGCTPKGLKIPENEQFRFNRMVPSVVRPPVSVIDPFLDINKSSIRALLQPSRIGVLDDPPQEENRPWNNTSSNRDMILCPSLRPRTPERKPLIGLVPRLKPQAAPVQARGLTRPESPSASPPPVAREAETPQMNQTFAGALQFGSNSASGAGASNTASVPLFGQAPSMFSGTQIFGNQTNPEVNTGMRNQTLFQTQPQVFGVAAGASTFPFGLQQNGFPNTSTPASPPRFPEAREDETSHMIQAFAGALQFGSNSAAGAGASQTASVPLFGQAPSMFSGTQIFGNQTNTEVNTGMTNQTLFQTSPQVFGAATKASPFSSGAQQNIFSNPSLPSCPPSLPVAREAETPQMTQIFTDTLQFGSKSAADAGACHTTSLTLFGQTPLTFSGTQIFGNTTNSVVSGTSNQTMFQTPVTTEASTFSFGLQQNVFLNTSRSTSSSRFTEAREAKTPQMTQTFTDSLQIGSNSDRDSVAHGTASSTQSSPTGSATNISGNQTNPADEEVKTETSNRTPFETPQKVTERATRARRALDFSTGVQQLESWDIPTTTAQETFIRMKKRDIDRAKAKRDKIRADLEARIQKRERKMDRIKSSETDCKCSLDVEWVEINNVFLDVLKVVEEARRKALEPLEERSKKLEKETKVQVQKLQKEIDELKKSMDELDQNQDLEVSPPTGSDDPQSLKNVTLDTSFGSLRATTSKMMERIETKLEKLSSTELKRASKYAVDVKLDPTTAHPCLDVSADGKTVGHGEKVHKVPDCPQRFDFFGSLLGINRLTSGKSYWEVDVRNKSGWDLGVARGGVTRKGKLSVNTDKGFWVVVHYEDKKYAALTVPPVCLALSQKPQKVGVFVDYEEGLVSFYDVTAKLHIHSFTECSFSGDVFPYFSPHLKQNEKNSAPLIISALNTQK